ncbi:MAG: HlyD family efflux transporter periplasmic adaptor subunit [Oscillibacter sp.]|nr:HlyD family efflux transporter periplasmic adaptor subunit [Oscillibacter sp.]
MAELMENTEQTTPVTQQTPAEQAPEKKPKKKLSRKARRRIVRLIILAVILGAAGFAAHHFLGGGGSSGRNTEVVTDTVQYGAITAKVDGNGLTKAKNSETITITTSGTVQDVMVSEGDTVTAGTPLFVIDSEAARTAVEKARKDVEGYEKQLRTLQKDIAGLNLAAGYAGKLMDTITLNPGDEISKGQKVATLADDTRLRLTQYYSYAYAGDLKQGQTMEVSIPALMSTLQGKIEAVHMVSRITPEGSKLFSVDVIVENQGALTAEMEASAIATVNGEAVYPYEPGKLEYYRVGDLNSTVSGTVLSSALVDYLPVSAGQVLVRIDGEDSESEIFSVEQSLDDARDNLETAQKNLANCSAVAPIDGRVIGLNIQIGDEVPANTAVVTISDTSTIIVNATVDEMNSRYIQKGMMVDLDQWGTPAFGVVESFSLSSTVNNGVATYPMVISVDNSDGSIQVNSNIRYSLVASQNDNCLVVPIQCVRTVATEEGETMTVVYVGGEKPENALEGINSDEEIPEGFWPVQVETGIQDTYNVEIRSGLEKGMEVFTQIQTMEAWG